MPLHELFVNEPMTNFPEVFASTQIEYLTFLTQKAHQKLGVLWFTLWAKLCEIDPRCFMSYPKASKHNLCQTTYTFLSGCVLCNHKIICCLFFCFVRMLISKQNLPIFNKILILTWHYSISNKEVLLLQILTNSQTKRKFFSKHKSVMV